MKILNFGSLNYDYVYSVNHIVQPGETISSLGMETFCGGKGLNQSIALARAGAKVYHAGMIGEDGALLQSTCEDNGIDTEFIFKESGKSGHAIIQLDEKGQNCILLYTGANGKNKIGYIDQVLSSFGSGDVILLQNEINLLDCIIEKAYAKGMRIILNPSPYDDRFEQCDLRKVSLFLMNEIEGWQITGEKEPERILQAMEDKFPGAEVVLTLGADGCRYHGHGLTLSQSGYQVEVVDTTAAGDTFTGYFIADMARGTEIPKALQTASAAAALAVMTKGAASSIPNQEAVEQAGFCVR